MSESNCFGYVYYENQIRPSDECYDPGSLKTVYEKFNKARLGNRVDAIAIVYSKHELLTHMILVRDGVMTHRPTSNAEVEPLADINDYFRKYEPDVDPNDYQIVYLTRK